MPVPPHRAGSRHGGRLAPPSGANEPRRRGRLGYVLLLCGRRVMFLPQVSGGGEGGVWVTVMGRVSGAWKVLVPVDVAVDGPRRVLGGPSTPLSSTKTPTMGLAFLASFSVPLSVSLSPPACLGRAAIPP